MSKITLHNAVEYHPHRYSCFASDIGLPPGIWPALLDTDLGNKRMFVQAFVAEHEGDIAYVQYRQAHGCLILQVHND